MQAGRRLGEIAGQSSASSPIKFSMRDGASTSTDPSGSPQMARTSCSNWLVAQASMVQ